MNSFRAFIREKGLYLVCLALIFAATITSIWAIRNVVHNVEELTKSQQEKQIREDKTWDMPDTQANTPVTDLPESTPAPTTPSASPVPSAQPSAPASSSGAASASANAPGGSGTGAASSGQGASLPGAPVAGKITQGYSGAELVYSATLGDWRTHNGADYAAAAGEQVTACKAGKVSAATADALWGGVVEITDAGGTVWKYCGLAQPTLKVGDSVQAGDTVGTIGTLPCEEQEGSHLHLECKQGADWINPESLQ
ncbi:MAG: M23 family metallopeptidase [Gemmiger sp.]|nr:M23 family metallopeptidase [Gemmiger sp.]